MLSYLSQLFISVSLSITKRLLESQLFIKLWMMGWDHRGGLGSLRFWLKLWRRRRMWVRDWRAAKTEDNILLSKYRRVSRQTQLQTLCLTPRPVDLHVAQSNSCEERHGNVSSRSLQMTRQAEPNYNNQTNRATHSPTWLEGASQSCLIYVSSQKLCVALWPNTHNLKPKTTSFHLLHRGFQVDWHNLFRLFTTHTPVHSLKYTLQTVWFFFRYETENNGCSFICDPWGREGSHNHTP